VGVEPTGDAFNSVIRLDTSLEAPDNPMVNAGAIADREPGERRTDPPTG
jgi:glutaminase